MPSPESDSPDESFFNDLSQQPQETTPLNSQEAPNEGTSKQKRIACILCRKRKLKCDGTRPTCGTCKRLSHDCAYDEVRKKSGPKRGYVKLLEQRLQQVETLLKNQDTTEPNGDAARKDSTSSYVANTVSQALPNSGANVSGAAFISPDSRVAGGDASHNGASHGNGDQDFSWEMIGLGLEEPLPPQDVMDELYDIYFTKVHPSLPVIHRPRFLAALNLAPHMRPPICLRYIMWTLAASITDKYDALQEHFYHRSRKYAQMDEMKGHGESTITLSHCQSWILLATYEFKCMYFPRAWMSAGRAVRLAQMMQLHRLDGVGLDVKQCLPPPKDWTEREERRRTFWMSFCVDRYASIGTGWPMTIDERDIMTNLPASEDAFEKNRPMATCSLDQVLRPNGASNLQAFGAVILTAAMFGRNLLHLHRPTPEDNDEDINGGFWTRHRSIEQILLQTSLGLPEHLRLPRGLSDPNTIFSNMCLHTSAICLHQAAIFKADKYRMPASVSNESKIRCVTAAAEIASAMRMISHMDLAAMNPFISFCVYVAARVFVQYLKTRPNDQQMASSLQFLMQAMHALRRKNPLTESFLVQLDLDLESAGIPGFQNPPKIQNSVIPVNTDAVKCSPIYEIRESQNPSAPINAFNAGDLNHAQGAPTFGNNILRGMPSRTSSEEYFSEHHSGPPFHVAAVNIDMETRNSAYLPPQISAQSGLAATSSKDFAPASFTFQDTNDMDLTGDRSEHPSPETISSQSRIGSNSQSSYSPGSATYPLNEHQLPYRASPKPGFSNISNSGPLPNRSTGASNLFPNMPSTQASVDMFSNAFSSTGAASDQTFQNGFLVTNEWDFDPMNTGTGMTPMSEGSWNEMLQNVTMGWDTGLPQHSDMDAGQ